MKRFIQTLARRMFGFSSSVPKIAALEAQLERANTEITRLEYKLSLREEYLSNGQKELDSLKQQIKNLVAVAYQDSVRCSSYAEQLRKAQAELKSLKEPRIYPNVQCPDWTAENALHWKTFLLTPAGKALWERARAREVSLCIASCSGTEDAKMSGGMTFTLNWLESLARPEIISSAEDAKSAKTDTANSDTQPVETEFA